MKNIFFMLALLSVSGIVYSQDILLLKSNGKVVIGDTSQMTTPGNYKLYVQNGILTEMVKVSVKTTSEWSDDSFDHLPTLADVALSIQQKKHLVNMPGADALVKDGYELKSMDAKLLEQIEWLWMHMIALEKENNRLKKEMMALKNEPKK